MRYILSLGCVLGLLATSFVPVLATPFTPMEWKQRVEKHLNKSFVSQRKHTTWVRDQNRNFIDDIIDRRFGEVKEFDVIVDLNSFLKTNEIKTKFRDYGNIKYICKMITSVFLDNVKAKYLPEIAKMHEVAMIEIQHGFQPALDTSARAAVFFIF